MSWNAAGRSKRTNGGGEDRDEQPPLWHDAVHLWTLSAFAFAQPLYDLLGKNFTFFVARGSQPVDSLIFVFGLSIGLPALIIVPGRCRDYGLGSSSAP